MAEERETHFTLPYIAGQISGKNRDSLPPQKCRLLYNFFTREGVAEKVPGTSLYLQSAEGSDPITFVKMFNYRWFFQLGTKFIGEPSEGAQTETLYSSDFDKDTIASDIWRGALYLVNGKQMRFFDGTQVKEFGLAPPGNGKSPRTSNNGYFSNGVGTLTVGTYKYTFTYFDSETETESLPIGTLVDEKGIFSTQEFDADLNPLGWISFEQPAVNGAQSIVIDFPTPIFTDWFNDRPARADTLRMYRAFDAGAGYGDYRLVTEFTFLPGAPFLSPNTYNDNTNQADLGALLIPDELAPPPNRTYAINGGADPSGTDSPKFIRFWRDSMWLFGAKFPEYTVVDTTKNITNKNFASDSTLYASDTELPEYFPFDWEIGRQDNQRPTGIGVAGDTLCAFKEYSIYTILGDNLNNFIPKIKDPARGCVAPRSLCETPYGIVFLASDGICVFDGSGPSKLISKDINDEIRNINRPYFDKIRSEYIHDENRYIMHFPSGTAQENTRFIAYEFDNDSWSVGRSPFVASIATGVTSENINQLMIGSQINGRLLEWSNPTNFNYDGSAITCILRSADFDFGRSDKNKKLVWLYITAACFTSFIIDVTAYADYAQGPIYEENDIDSDGKFARYASSSVDPAGATYDKSRYADTKVIKRLKIPLEGIGRKFYIEILEKQNSEDLAGFEILSIDVEGIFLGK